MEKVCWNWSGGLPRRVCN